MVLLYHLDNYLTLVLTTIQIWIFYIMVQARKPTAQHPSLTMKVGSEKGLEKKKGTQRNREIINKLLDIEYGS